VDTTCHQMLATILDLEITSACLYGWLKQDRIDRGEFPGRTTAESRELRKARRRIRGLEDEVEILLRATPCRCGNSGDVASPVCRRVQTSLRSSVLQGQCRPTRWCQTLRC
jgi:transposase-like protein